MSDREQLKHSDVFGGPVFLVGLPRSGTKLLRELLNNHSQVAITPQESNCIPHFYHNRAKYGDLKEDAAFDRFYFDFSRTHFFRSLDEGSGYVTREAWYAQVTHWSYGGVIEAFYRSHSRYLNKRIWGDKTPSYLVQVPLLKMLFPTARFIHIVRDVRDQSLSLHESRQKNIFTSAQRWNDAIMKFREDARAHARGDCLEIRYERLTDFTEETMRSVCDFLEVPFEREVTELNKRLEPIAGAGMHTTEIVKKNYGKWRHKLPARDVVKIEKLCGMLLAELGYPTSYNGTPKRLNKFEVVLYNVLDAAHSLAYEIRHRGLRQGVLCFVQLRKKGWYYQTPVNIP